MTIPRCPFCWGSLSFPEEIRLDDAETILGGSCFSCSARFVIDVTGKNVGEAMVSGLRMIAQDLGTEIALLDPDFDYEDAVLRYDVKQHRTLGSAGNIIDCFGRMYVIRIRRLKEAA